MTTAAARYGSVYRCAMCRYCDQEIQTWTGQWRHTGNGEVECDGDYFGSGGKL